MKKLLRMSCVNGMLLVSGLTVNGTESEGEHVLFKGLVLMLFYFVRAIYECVFRFTLHI